MDNRVANIVSMGIEELFWALALLWANAPGGKATHYKICKYRNITKYFGNPTLRHIDEMVEDPEKGTETLILFWDNTKGAIPLPYPMNLERTVDFVEGWLSGVEYGPEPDNDGSNKRGWRVFTEDWGIVAGHHRAILAVQPEWAMFGK